MAKPEPKIEMLVTRETDIRRLVIHVGTPDAREWVMTEAPPYGELYERNAATIHLWVSPLYDLDEVFEYMSTGYSAGDESPQAPE